MDARLVRNLTPSIVSKLKEKGVSQGDHAGAIEALKGCVLAGRLIAAYKIINDLPEN